MTRSKQEALVRLYKNNLTHHGCLTTHQRKVILGLENEYGTTVPDFWHNVKRYAQSSLLDLELLCRIGDDTLVGEVFQPLDRNECANIRITLEPRYREDYPTGKYPNVDGIHKRTDLKFIVDTILACKPIADDWRDTFAKDLLSSCLVYFARKQEFQNNLHQRFFQDLKDLISLKSSSSLPERTLAENDLSF